MDMLTAFHFAAWSLQRMAENRDDSWHPPAASAHDAPPPGRASSGAVRRLAAWLRRRRASRALAAPCHC